MSLLDDLKAAAGALDIQFQPSTNEVQGVVGAIVHYLEHGDKFLQAAASGTEDLGKLLAPPPPEPEPEPAAPAPAGAASSPQDLEKQIADLQAQLAARQATANQTTVTHETGAPPAPAGTEAA